MKSVLSSLCNRKKTAYKSKNVKKTYTSKFVCVEREVIVRINVIYLLKEKCIGKARMIKISKGCVLHSLGKKNITFLRNIFFPLYKNIRPHKLLWWWMRKFVVRILFNCGPGCKGSSDGVIPAASSSSSLA